MVHYLLTCFFLLFLLFFIYYLFFLGGGGGSKTPLAFLFEIFYNKKVFHGGVPHFLVRFLSFRMENLNLFFENFAWNLCLCFLLSFWGLWLRHYKFPRLYKGRTYCICLRSGRISVKTLNLCYPHVSHVLSVVLSTHPIVPERSWQILTLSICHLFHNTPPFPRE